MLGHGCIVTWERECVWSFARGQTDLLYRTERVRGMLLQVPITALASISPQHLLYIMAAHRPSDHSPAHGLISTSSAEQPLAACWLVWHPVAVPAPMYRTVMLTMVTQLHGVQLLLCVPMQQQQRGCSQPDEARCPRCQAPTRSSCGMYCPAACNPCRRTCWPAKRMPVVRQLLPSREPFN